MKLYVVIILLILKPFTDCFAQATNQKVNPSSKLTSIAKDQKQDEKYNLEIELFEGMLAKDSLKQASRSIFHKKRGLLHYKNKEYNKAKKHFYSCIKLDSISKTSADSYFNLALIYRKQMKRDSLFHSLNQSLIIYNRLKNSKAKYNTYSKAGILYKQAKKYDKAIQCLLLAFNGFSDIEDIANKATVSGNIADVHRLLGRKDVAKIYYKIQVNLRTIINNPIKLSFAYNNIANFFYLNEQYDSASYYYHNALDIQKNNNDEKNLATTLSNLAMVHFSLDSFHIAEGYYKEALIKKEAFHDKNSIIRTINELILVSLKMGKRKQAKRYLFTANKYINKIYSTSVMERFHFAKYEYYKFIGDHKKALEEQTKQFKLYRELFSQEQDEIVQTLQEEFESKLKTSKISELTKENASKDGVILTQNKDIEKQNILLAFSGILLVIFIGIYFFIKQNQKNKIQKLEYQKLKEVQKGQDIIKSNISKDLHDLITSSYDAVRLKLLALKKAKDTELIIDYIVNDIQTINHEIRLISHRLSPLDDKLKNCLLTDLIVLKLSEFQNYTKVFVNVKLPLPKIVNQMNSESKKHIIGIILEALSNIEKHSNASKVVINIHEDKQKKILTFEISDNGIGFKQKNKSKGIGISNIEQRVYLLKGNFRINGNSSGTYLYMTIPIKQNL